MSVARCRHLVVGPSFDAHSELITTALNSRGCDVRWIRSDWPLPSLEELASADFDRVVFRRSQTDLHDDPGIENFIAGETRSYFLALGEMTPQWAWFPGSPLALSRAALKPLQLAIARRVGLSTPPTVVGSSGDDLDAFFASHPAIVCKPLSAQVVNVAGERSWVGTTNVAAITAAHQMAPAIFQSRVEIESELRVTVMREATHFFSPAVTNEQYTDLKDVPPGYAWNEVQHHRRISILLREMMNELEIDFCSADFVVDRQGATTFLELNPNGQWYFLQQSSGVDLMTNFLDAVHSGS